MGACRACMGFIGHYRLRIEPNRKRPVGIKTQFSTTYNSFDDVLFRLVMLYGTTRCLCETSPARCACKTVSHALDDSDRRAHPPERPPQNAIAANRATPSGHLVANTPGLPCEPIAPPNRLSPDLCYPIGPLRQFHSARFGVSSRFRIGRFQSLTGIRIFSIRGSSIVAGL